MISTKEHAPVHFPLYVTPLLSMRNPAPPGSQTEMYAVALFPEHPLKIGDAVHLHLLCPLNWRPGGGLETLQQAPAIPLEIKGWISGERERSELEVEFVVRNEDEDATVRRAFIRASADPRMSATPTLPAGNRGLRHSERRMEQRSKVARGSVAGPRLEVARGGPVGPPHVEGERGSDPGAQSHGTEGRVGGLARASDRGRWVVCTSLTTTATTGGARPPDKDRRARGCYATPGPTRQIPLPWLTPSGRSRRGRSVGVGGNMGRSSETPGRGPRDLYQS
ncbi:hypothetical protein TRAPUB_10381 [Trametes pubescens]|uniref:Uncharacterized protein n=1 Tax=Trametes pubescens TaxID=154538 RepID=A0A1M2VZQ2_TRAPU|nr:hypothetical protein TRAPUB_10381 [Trametes pubescens]